MNEVIGIVLAAGKGTRMNCDRPKVLHPVAGKPLIYYPISSLRKSGIDKIYVVVGYKKEKLKKILANNDLEFIHQKSLKGTADALIKVIEQKKIKEGTDIVLLYGDFPLIYPNFIKKQLAYHKKQRADCTLAVLNVSKSKRKDYFQFGRVLRDRYDNIIEILEKEEKAHIKVNEINIGIYCFRYSLDFYKCLKKIKPSAKGELYLTHIIEKCKNNNLKTAGFNVSPSFDMLGVNTQKDIAKINKIVRLKLIDNLMKKGVTFIDPDSTYIEIDSKIGKDTIIYPNVYIESGVKIGKKCVIGPNSRIRRGTVLKDEVEIGNFVEIARSKISSKVKIKHFSYIGDAIIKENVNIGAGTVTANYDGTKKSCTSIGKDSFVGSGTIFIAPVNMGSRAITGAGAVVTSNSKIADGETVVGIPARSLSH